jgi:WhiB family redox-sensing transcriptional regulator
MPKSSPQCLACEAERKRESRQKPGNEHPDYVQFKAGVEFTGSFKCGHPKRLANATSRGRAAGIGCRACVNKEKRAREKLRRRAAKAVGVLDLDMLRTQPPEQPDNQAWKQHAACRGHDPDLWFAGWKDGAEGKQRRQAIAICATCPVRRLCLNYGATDPNGIYGGIDEKHRRAYQVGATKWSELEALSDQLAEKAEKAA